METDKREDAGRRPSILSQLLTAAGVPHTVEYTDERLRTMPFQSLFGLGKLLKEYGVDSQGLRLAKVGDMAQLPRPFLAEMADGYRVVADESDVNAVMADGSGATGVVMCVYPKAEACEPGYTEHRITEIGTRVKPWVLAASLAVLLVYTVVINRIFSHPAEWVLMFVDMAGLFFSHLLILKQLRVHSRMAERVCGVIEKEGCSKVLATDASSFMGLFHWSEVGVAYFGISLVTLIAFPSAWPMLAAVNVCCLPFTFWSVWYQHWRAKAWCTLCLCVQCLLWVQFACYLIGGITAKAWPLTPNIVPLVAAYVAALLILNRLLSGSKDEEYDKNE